MRVIIAIIAITSTTATLKAADTPLVEKYLQSGQLSEGKQALEAVLATNNGDDQARFGLAMLQLISGVERLGQSLFRYGAISENTVVPILRLPVPKNPGPDQIDYAAFRRIFDEFNRGVTATEGTLADIKDDNVKLPLRLVGIHVDLDGDGKPTDEFMDVLSRIVGRQSLTFLDSNPEFLVCCDRGDVAWLRAYCHVLAAMTDFALAFDGEKRFNLWSETVFTNPKHRLEGDNAEKRRKRDEGWDEFVVKEPKRLGSFRQHMMSMASLNRETWKYIRAETDDDHEWLPNPKQTGVLGMPVRDEMIDAWLRMLEEMEALFDGRRTLLRLIAFNEDKKGLNLKVLLDEPPEKFVFDTKFPLNLDDKYWSNAPDMDLNALFSVIRVFGQPTAVGYAAWFN